MKFGSNEWGNAFKEVINNDTEFTNGLADPENFTLNMEFAVPGTKFHLRFESGKLIYTGEPKYKEEELALIITTDSETWQKIASGQEQATKMLDMGKITVQKGPMDAVLGNAGAFNCFMADVGKVPTEW